LGEGPGGGKKEIRRGKKESQKSGRPQLRCDITNEKSVTRLRQRNASIGEKLYVLRKRVRCTA